MAEVEIDDSTGTALVPGAHRVVRVLDATEGPFAGTLVTSGTAVAVRVDAKLLGGWAGWRFAGTEHIAAPIDVVRRRGGQDVLLPWCTDQVLGYLVRRSATGAALTSGECCTLAVSLLRGLGEIGDDTEIGKETAGSHQGRWWLTDQGRPVFAFGAGLDAREGAREILQRLTAHCADKVLRRPLGVIEQALAKVAAQPRVSRKLLDDWEQDLLLVAAPQPLDLVSHAPQRARELAQGGVVHDLVPVRDDQRLRGDLRLRATGAEVSRPSGRRGGRGVTDGNVVRAAVEAIAVRVSGLRQAGAARSTRKAHGKGSADTRYRKRRSLIFAGAVAAVVFGVGLLWPSGGQPGEAAAERRSVPVTALSDASEPGKRSAAEGESSSAIADVSATAVARPEQPEGDALERQEDSVVAASALLVEISGCRAQADASCSSAVAAGSDGVISDLDVVDQGTPTIELIDEYGDVAVLRLRVDAPEGHTQETGTDALAQRVVVLIRVREKWLVRDVYDVADQPG